MNDLYKYAYNHQFPINALRTLQHDTMPFLEKFQKVKFRDLEGGRNTRMNVNNADYIKHKEKKERALNYWKDRVSQDFLPPIDPTRGGESLDQLIKLREERSPDRLVSEMRDAKK
jgi:hypothetical protein